MKGRVQLISVTSAQLKAGDIVNRQSEVKSIHTKTTGSDIIIIWDDDKASVTAPGYVWCRIDRKVDPTSEIPLTDELFLQRSVFPKTVLLYRRGKATTGPTFKIDVETLYSALEALGFER